jgi:hypothetical protein
LGSDLEEMKQENLRTRIDVLDDGDEDDETTDGPVSIATRSRTTAAEDAEEEKTGAPPHSCALFQLCWADQAVLGACAATARLDAIDNMILDLEEQMTGIDEAIGDQVSCPPPLPRDDVRRRGCCIFRDSDHSYTRTRKFLARPLVHTCAWR